MSQGIIHLSCGYRNTYYGFVNQLCYFMEEECEEKLLALRVNNNIKLKFCKFVPPISENDYFCTVSSAIIHTILLGEAAMFYIVNLCSTSLVIVCTGENEGRK